MNRDQITEIFIRAAWVDKKLPQTAKPKPVKAMNIGYVHAFSDLAGYGEEYRKQWFADWLDPENLRVSQNDMGIWLASMEMIKLVKSAKNRRALWAWARSQAGNGRFARWCKRVEGITRQLGDWRKNTAISDIELAFASKSLLHNDISAEQDFTNTPEISDKRDNISVWRDYSPQDMMRCHFDDHLLGVTVEEIQSAKRREREARRRKAA